MDRLINYSELINIKMFAMSKLFIEDLLRVRNNKIFDRSINGLGVVVGVCRHRSSLTIRLFN